MWDYLTDREADYCNHILEQQNDSLIINSISNVLASNGGITGDNKPFLFELRFAHELNQRGYSMGYEVPGEGSSSIDFQINTTSNLKILSELVSIRVSDVVNDGTLTAIDSLGVETNQLILSTNNEDPRLSEEGEIFLVQQKICEKVFKNGSPTKFLETSSSDADFHLIIVDMRGFLGGNGCDNNDCIQLCYGNSRVPEHCRRYWGDGTSRNPIIGLFEDSSTRPRGVNLLKERVHAILFTWDTGYTLGSFLSNESCCLVCNPHLIDDERATMLKEAFFD